MRGWRHRYLRFSLFLATLLIATLAAAYLLPRDRLPLALMVGFDVAAVQFLATTFWMFAHDTPATIKARAALDDPNHHQLVWIGLVIMVAVLIALGIELREQGAVPVLLSVATLALAWTFGNLLFALQYAHVYYAKVPGKPAGGIEFPGKQLPDHWDFSYFAFVLGMTFQVSDVVITNQRVRRIALVHGLIGFVFNIGIIGVSVGIIGSLFRS